MSDSNKICEYMEKSIYGHTQTRLYYMSVYLKTGIAGKLVTKDSHNKYQIKL